MILEIEKKGINKASIILVKLPTQTLTHVIWQPMMINSSERSQEIPVVSSYSISTQISKCKIEATYQNREFIDKHIS